MKITISTIDKQIDAIHKQLRKLEAIDPMSAQSWQDAWDKHPHLLKAEIALYAQRGQLQQIRDIQQAKVDAKIRVRLAMADSKAATRRTHVYAYLHDCANGAKVLGIPTLSAWYAGGLRTFSQSSNAM